MKKKGEGVHWKEIGALVLFGVVLIILLSCFPKTTSRVINVAGYIVAAILIACPLTLNWKFKRSQKPAGEITDEPDDLERQPKRPRQQSPANPRRFYFEISVYAISIGCAAIHSLLKNLGTLTPRIDLFLLVTALFVASVFCTCNLFWGLREKCTWCRGFRNIYRNESPANYWVAIGLWTVFTAGFLAGFTIKIVELILG